MSVMDFAYGTLENAIPTWMKCSSSVSTCWIPRSSIMVIEVRSVNEIVGLS